MRCGMTLIRSATSVSDIGNLEMLRAIRHPPHPTRRIQLSCINHNYIKRLAIIADELGTFFYPGPEMMITAIILEITKNLNESQP